MSPGRGGGTKSIKSELEPRKQLAPRKHLEPRKQLAPRKHLEPRKQRARTKDHGDLRRGANPTEPRGEQEV